MSEIIKAILFFSALFLAACWLSRRLPETCNCDDANQGRACRNCTPPHLPRGE